MLGLKSVLLSVSFVSDTVASLECLEKHYLEDVSNAQSL